MNQGPPRVDVPELGHEVVLRNTTTDAQVRARIASDGHDLTLAALDGTFTEVVQAPGTGFELIWPSRSYIIRLPWEVTAISGQRSTGHATGEANWTTRRQEPRSAIAVPVTVYRTGRIIKAITLDVSAGGLRLAVADTVDLSPGDTVRIRVSLPDRDVNGQIEVLRRTRDIGADTATLACRFVDMKDEHRLTLRRLCNRMLSIDPSTAPGGSNRPRTLSQQLVDRLTR